MAKDERRHRIWAALAVMVAGPAGCGTPAEEVPRPGDTEPALTSNFGTDYTGSEVGRFRPRGRFAVQLRCAAGDVQVVVRAEDEVLVSLDMNCTTDTRHEFDLTADRTAQVTFSAVSNGTAEGRADLLWLS